MVPAALALVGLFAYLSRPHANHQTAVTNSDVPSVKIATSDGISLAADVHLPIGTAQVPAVILIHQFGQDRHEWDAYVQKFVAEDFAVVTYDIRGFGQSNLQTIATSQMTWFNSMPNDVPAVIAYLKNQSRVDVGRIDVVGSVLGANIAFVSSTLADVHRTVLLSPSVTPGVLDGTGVANFSPKNILGVAGTTEKSDLDKTMATVSGEHERLDVDGGSLGSSLISNQDTLAHVLTWLKS